MKECSLLFCVGILILLPGCSSDLIDLGKKTFYQGDSLSIDLAKPQKYIRSVSVYDQFTLIASFDVLWLCPEVKEFYTSVIVRNLAKNDQQKEILIARNKDELKHFISFYIVTPYDIVLGDHLSSWFVLLKIDDSLYHPIEIKSIELHPLYGAIFSKRVMRFCNVYQIKFDARTLEDVPIIKSTTKDISLLFRSIDKELAVSWLIPSFNDNE